MKWHDKHFHTSPLTIRFLIKAQVLVPHTDWDARFTPPPTEHRSVEELPQWPRERERECVYVPLSVPSWHTCSRPSCSDTIPECTKSQMKEKKKKTVGAAGFTWRGVESMFRRQAGTWCSSLSLSQCPFCYHSVETWEARQALPSERRGSSPARAWTFTRAEWETTAFNESVCAPAAELPPSVRTQTAAFSQLLRAGGDGRSLALAWTDLRAVGRAE